jgi:hypothetical protein
MTCTQPSILHFYPYPNGQLEQAHNIGNMASRFADGFAKLLLCQPELIDQALETLCFLDRIEILPLEVFDQGGRHGVAISEVADKNWHLMQPRLLRGAPSAFARNNLEVAWR